MRRVALLLALAITTPALCADTLQLDRQDAALRALAYDMHRCGWPRANITAVLKFHLFDDQGIQRFWARVKADTHRPWFRCPDSR